jgi:hypothetical protein
MTLGLVHGHVDAALPPHYLLDGPRDRRVVRHVLDEHLHARVDRRDR